MGGLSQRDCRPGRRYPKLVLECMVLRWHFIWIDWLTRNGHVLLRQHLSYFWCGLKFRFWRWLVGRDLVALLLPPDAELLQL